MNCSSYFTMLKPRIIPQWGGIGRHELLQAKSVETLLEGSVYGKNVWTKTYIHQESKLKQSILLQVLVKYTLQTEAKQH